MSHDATSCTGRPDKHHRRRPTQPTETVVSCAFRVSPRLQTSTGSHQVCPDHITHHRHHTHEFCRPHNCADTSLTPNCTSQCFGPHLSTSGRLVPPTSSADSTAEPTAESRADSLWTPSADSLPFLRRHRRHRINHQSIEQVSWTFRCGVCGDRSCRGCSKNCLGTGGDAHRRGCALRHRAIEHHTISCRCSRGGRRWPQRRLMQMSVVQEILLASSCQQWWFEKISNVAVCIVLQCV